MWLLTLVLLCGGLLTATADTCSGRCEAAVDHSKPCQCNAHCDRFNDCCSDYYRLCTQTSCYGKCGDNYNSALPCQCNTLCSNYANCCPDYQHFCSLQIPTDIRGIASLIWEKDVNRASSSHFTVNHQGKTTTSSHTDHAPHPFFSHVNEGAMFSKPTYSRFISLLDNYDHNDRNTEHLTAHEWQEIEHFLDAILATDVMKHTEAFLRNNGHVTGGDSAFREKLHKVWFELYRRTNNGAISSSGFEHVFVGESKSTTVSGFHNWIQFYQEEKKHILDYKGYVAKAEPDLVGAQFSWHGGLWKAKGTFFVGTSPEFDMAIYTICFLMKPGQTCSFQHDGHNVSVKTYDNANWSGQQVATAYPL